MKQNARARVAGVSARVTEAFTDLPALQGQWEVLFQSRPNEPSTSFEWTSAMVRHHVRSGDRCFLLRVDREGTLAGLVPLVLRRFKVMGQQIALLTPLSEDYNTHSDLLLASTDEAVVEAVVSSLFTLTARWDCFRMARLLDANPLLPVLRKALMARHCSHSVREGLAAYVLDLPSCYDAYLAARSQKFRNHLKRAERKLSANGTVKFHELSHDQDFDAAFGALLQIEQGSWKQSFGSSITAVARQSGFYRDFASAAFGRGALHLQWLTINAQPVAYNLGYMTQGGYHYLKTSYDHAYRPVSPATVLRARLVEGLIERGVDRLDFPGEPYEWESQWTDTVRRRTVLSVYPPTVRGRLLALIDRVRHRPSANRDVTHVDPRSGRAQPYQAMFAAG